MKKPSGFVSPSAKAPLRAPMELPISHPLATDHYFPQGELLFLSHMLQWELVNLALFHRAAFETVAARDKILDDMASRIPDEAPDELQEDRLDAFLHRQSAQRTQVHAGEIENRAIAGYADELTIVGLWAIAEKNLGMALEKLKPGLSEYRWDALKRGYLGERIDLTKLPGFNGANECREVNNAIKHAGAVTEKLSKFPAFSQSLGKALRSCNLDVQRYMICVHNLLGAVMEEVGHKAAGAQAEALHPYRTDADGHPIPRPATPSTDPD